MTNEPSQPHAADRLLAAVERLDAPACVGLDPVVERLPSTLRPTSERCGDRVEAIEGFSWLVIEAIAGVVPVVKFQSACYERYGEAGVGALRRLVNRARRRGLEVILDAKRGDIGISAAHYAAASFAPDAAADWVTINAYLGPDAVEPFLVEGHGAFALVQTSNPGAVAVQERRLEGGGTVAQAVAAMIDEVGAGHVGERGYSSLGAVVGATRPETAAALRSIMPRQVFLVPGYGAQGGSADDVLPCFNPDGTGAIVTASRSVIYAFDEGDPDWPRAVRAAAERLAGDLREALRRR